MIGVVARKRRGKMIPLPGSVLPGNWIVTHADSGGATSYDAEKKIARMTVDTHNAKGYGRFVRRHEMGHAKFSPWEAFSCDQTQRPTEIFAAFRNGFEDCRIHELLFRAGVDIKEDETPEIVQGWVDSWSSGGAPDWAIASVLAVGGPHTPIAAAAFEKLTLKAIKEAGTGGRWTAERIVEAIKRMCEIITRKPKFELVVQFSKACERMWQREEEKKDPDGNELEEEELRSEEKMDEKELRNEETASWRDEEQEDPAFSEHHGKWGRMDIVRKDLLLPFKAKREVQDFKARPADNGGRVKWPVRIFSDQMVFEKVKRGKGRAVILIDYSGSMAMSQADLEDLMLRAPGCLIACYSGNGVKGDLVILADDGKRVGSMPRSMGGNTIDGPALDWLAKQKAVVRMWISDGEVHGVGGFSVNLLKECRDKVRTNRIKHVLTIDDAESLLAKTFGA